jgi:hypothetical protein
VGSVIEPVAAPCFESDSCELLALVHDRHPVWTRLELAEGAQGNFRMARDPLGRVPAHLRLRPRWSTYETAAQGAGKRENSYQSMVDN